MNDAAVGSRLIVASLSDSRFSVTDPAGSGDAHSVELHKHGPQCDCADFAYRGRQRPCKHIAAAIHFQESRKPQPESPPPMESSNDERCSDLGNARRLVRLHGEDLRYVRSQRHWYVWDARRWREDATDEAVRKAKDVVDALHIEAANTSDGNLKKELARWAMQSDSAFHIRAMVELASSERAVVLRQDQLDAGPFLLNTLNGTLDVRSGELRPHRREDYFTKLATVRFDPKAEAPRFVAFLHEILRGDVDVIGYLQCVIGYALTADVREQCFFLLYGTGANGKTTLLELLRHLFGDYARQSNFSTFLARRDDTVRADLARLAGARLVTAVEAEEGQRFAESLVKQLVGGDMITARRLYRDEIEFRPTFKLFLAANHKPQVWGTDHAFWRRVRLIPFTVTIPPERQDRGLLNKLRSELPGILNWALEGCRQWLANGLQEPAAVLAATRAYEAEQDLVGEFVNDRCVLSSNGRAQTARVERKELYGLYETWCRETGTPALSSKTFNGRIRERGVPEVKVHGGKWFWVGLELRNADASATTAIEASDEPPF